MGAFSAWRIGLYPHSLSRVQTELYICIFIVIEHVIIVQCVKISQLSGFRSLGVRLWREADVRETARASCPTLRSTVCKVQNGIGSMVLCKTPVPSLAQPRACEPRLLQIPLLSAPFSAHPTDRGLWGHRASQALCAP